MEDIVSKSEENQKQKYLSFFLLQKMLQKNYVFLYYSN